MALGLLACAGKGERGPGTPASGGDEGAAGTGGSGGSAGSGGAAGTGGNAGTGGATAGTGGTAGMQTAGTGGGTPDATTTTETPDADMSVMPDAPMTPRDAGGGDGSYPDSAFLPGRPDIRLCKKEWTQEQCCMFLCSCLNTICADSAKGKPGLATCMSWCPKISNMAMRCHVYHCYISISPTGGIKDHDSHCGHAANQVQGGDCPAPVYQ